MKIVLTTAEIDLLWSTKTAQENYVYVCDDGFLYKGQKDGTLVRLLNTNFDDWQKQKQSNQNLPFRNKTIIQGVSDVDGSIIDVKLTANGIKVDVASSTLALGAATEATQLLVKAKTDNLDVALSTRLKPSDTLSKVSVVDTITNPVTVNAGANLNTSALALETTQTLIKTNTDKIPALGQALAAASLPIVLTAAQIATLTPPAQITGFALAANQQTNAITDAQIRATALPISASVLPLPTGAATETTLSAVNGKLPSGLTVTASRLQVELPAGGTGLTNTELRASAVPVSLTSTTITNFPATQAVSGTVTANIGTTNGLALDATLTGGTQKAIARTAAKGTTVAADLTSTPVDNNTQALDVSIKGTSTVAVNNFPATQPVSGTVTANSGTNLNTSLLALDSTVAKDASLTTLNASVNSLLKPASTLAAITAITNTVTIKADTALNQTNALKVDGSAVTQPISAASLPLPTGSSTSALQTTGNTSLSTIDTKTPSLGQALAASSTPVVLTAAQIITLTPPAAITGFALAANQQTNAITDTQIRATPLPISGTVSTGGLTDTQIRATALPISAASLPLPTGASTETTLAAINTKLPSGLVVTTGRLQVELPAGGTGLTNTELRATPVPISGTVTSTPSGTQTITGTITANAGTNLNTSLLALDSTVAKDATLTSGTQKSVLRTAAKGTTVAADTTSTPVDANTQALDVSVKGSVAVTGSFFQGTQPVSAASLPLPTGAATSANQQTNAITDTQIRATPLPISGTVSTGLTQPLTDTQIRATALPISGTVSANATLSAETTKVIGTVNVAGTIPISGTVSTNGLTDTQIRATALPVSGTFFQATQPVSGTISTGLSQPLTDTQLRATPVPVTMSNTLALTDTQLRASPVPMSLATNTPTLQAGSTTSVTQVTAANLNATVVGNGTFAVQAAATLSAETTKVIGTVNIATAQTLATVTTVSAVTAITNALPVGANTIGAVTNVNLDVALSTRLQKTDTLTAVALISDTRQTTPANLQMTATPIVITKGTQSTTGFTTQDLKDAGRNQVHYYTIIPVLTSATDTLQSLTGTKAGATVTATATPAVVTTGKTFRVTRLSATYIATAVSGYGIVRLRFNTAGVAAINSPIAATLLVGAGAPTTANSTGSVEAALDEGWEFAAATGIGISVQGFAAVTGTAVGYVLVSATGYEY